MDRFGTLSSFIESMLCADTSPAGFQISLWKLVSRRPTARSYSRHLPAALVLEWIHDSSKFPRCFYRYRKESSLLHLLVSTLTCSSLQHIYEVFSQDEVERTWDQHIQSVCNRGNDIQSFTQSNGAMWTIVGEWSLAAYDCALWLNGRGIGARWVLP